MTDFTGTIGCPRRCTPCTPCSGDWPDCRPITSVVACDMPSPPLTQLCFVVHMHLWKSLAYRLAIAPTFGTTGACNVPHPLDTPHRRVRCGGRGILTRPSALPSSLKETSTQDEDKVRLVGHPTLANLCSAFSCGGNLSATNVLPVRWTESHTDSCAGVGCNDNQG